MTKLHTRNQVSVRGFKSTNNHFYTFARGLFYIQLILQGYLLDQIYGDFMNISKRSLFVRNL
ncbi:MAG TPA: hypothetical protein V6C58_16785, partial [Allocoleopsis sp.]